MIKEAASRNKKSLVVTRGRKIVDQASQRLVREGVEHGVLMAGHWNYRPHLPIQVCSVDTLISRDLRPEADLIVIDEAHMATSKGYKELLTSYPNTYIVSVTATPYCDLRHLAQRLVHPISMEELTSLGYVAPFRYFAPNTPDLTGVKISSSTHDYVTNELETAMNRNGLSGNIVDHFLKIGRGRPTILFAVNIHHSRSLVEKFKGAGIRAEHCDADTTDTERESIISRLERRETEVVCNVGILSTGVDIPSVSCIVLARPTTSRNLFIQQCGRGTRICKGKSDCILLDHAGNILRHGFPTDETEIKWSSRSSTSSTNTKRCSNCFAMFRSAICPECGFMVKEETKAPEESSEQLREIDTVLAEYLRLQATARAKGYKRSWAMHQLIQLFTFDVASKYLDPWFIKRYLNERGPFSNSPYIGVKK